MDAFTFCGPWQNTPGFLHHAESAPSTCNLCTTWRFIRYGTIEVITLDKSEVQSPSTRMKIIRRSTRNEAHRIQSSTPPVHIKKRFIFELCHHGMVIPKKAQVVKHRASIFSHLELEWMSQGLGGWVIQIYLIGFPKHVKVRVLGGPFPLPFPPVHHSQSSYWNSHCRAQLRWTAYHEEQPGGESEELANSQGRDYTYINRGLVFFPPILPVPKTHDAFPDSYKKRSTKAGEVQGYCHESLNLKCPMLYTTISQQDETKPTPRSPVTPTLSQATTSENTRLRASAHALWRCGTCY